MIHYKLKKKDYISPHLEVTWMDSTPICDISAYGPDQPWGAKGTTNVIHFEPEFDDDFVDDEEVGYETFKVEW